MDELARVLGIEKPHLHFTEKIVHTKSDVKHRLHELKAERDRLLHMHDHNKLHQVRREMHALKHAIRKIDANAPTR